jgi:phospholipid transport system substrate-binding protein
MLVANLSIMIVTLKAYDIKSDTRIHYMKHYTQAARTTLAGLVLSAVMVTPVMAGPYLTARAPADQAIIRVVNTQGAEKFIQTMAGQAIEFLGGSNMSHEAKKSSFNKLLRDSFDMNTIGRFALGRYWKVANDAQQKEYLQLFNKMVVDVYSARFSEYEGQKFEVRATRPEGDKDVLVTSFIVPKSGPEIQVDWRVRERNGSFKIIDVIVEGVSMSVTQRSDFASVIQRGGGDVEVLLNHLRNR